MSFVDQKTILLLLRQEKHSIEEEGMPGSLGSSHSESTFRDQFATRSQVRPKPTVEKRLNFLNAYGVLVPPLHSIDVFRNASHRGKRSLNGTSAFSLIVSRITIGVVLLRQILQKQVILEDPLDGLQKEGAERQRVSQRRLPFAEGGRGFFLAH